MSLRRIGEFEDGGRTYRVFAKDHSRGPPVYIIEATHVIVVAEMGSDDANFSLARAALEKKRSPIQNCIDC